MTKTHEDLIEDAAFAATMVEYWAATRDYHDSEKQKAHVEYVKALRVSTDAQNALIAHQGASS